MSTLTISTAPSSSRCASLTESALYSDRSPQSIPESTHRLDEIARGAELRAQPLHVHVDGPRLNVRRGLPHTLEQLCAALHASAAVGEDHEKLVFRCGKVDG